MTARLDVLGKRFGKLVARRYSEKRTRQGLLLVECDCDCGRVHIIKPDRLGRTMSCGICIRAEVGERRRTKVIGERFGKLIAREYAGQSKSKSKTLLVRCDCDCGESTIAAVTDLNRGRHTSCGKCSRKKAVAAMHAAMEKAHAENDEKTLDGKKYLSFRAFAKRLQISGSAVQNWKKSCRFLGGRGISTYPGKGAYHEEDYYLEADATKIEKAREDFDAIPDLPGKIATTLAASELGLTGAELSHLLRKIKKKAKRERAGIMKNGSLGTRTYITRTLYETLQKLLAWGPNDCTESDAAEILGCALSTVGNLQQRGLLIATWRYGKHAEGARRESWVLSRKEVNGLHAARLKRPNLLIQRGHCVWTIDPRTDAERKESRRLPENTARPKAKRIRPSQERHERWRQWRLEGCSFGDIVLKERDLSGETVTRQAVVDAIRNT